MILNKKRHEDVVLHNNKVCIWKKDDSGNKIYKEISNYSTIKEIVENKDTGDMKARLEYDDGYDVKEISVGLGEIAEKKEIIKLVNKGLDVNSINGDLIIKHLANEKENAPKVYSHTNLGFRYYGEELYFNHHKMIAANKDKAIESTYDGDLMIKPKGSHKKWMSMVKSHVVGHTEMELALVIGFSAAMVGFLATEMAIESPLIHIYGDSSRGKSTAAMLAISAFGSPNPLEKGLFMTWNATGNAMNESMGGNVGIPILFDESSMSSIKDFTNTIYSLTSGKNKIRMNQDCDIRNPKVWKSTIVSTGENTLTGKSSQYVGIRARLFEFGNIPWTKDAVHAGEIKETVIANYGHYGKVFASGLMKLGKNKVKILYNECANRLKESIPKSQVKDRIAEKLALITATAEAMKQIMKLDLNISGIEKILIDNEIELVEDKDIAEKAYDVLTQKVAENGGKFAKYFEYSRRDSCPAQDRETWGIIETMGKGDNQEVKIVIIANIFNRILKENGFQEPKVILKKWKENGWLDHEKDKCTRRRKIGAMEKVTCYVIKVKKEEIQSKMAQESAGNSVKNEVPTKTTVKQDMMKEVKDGISPFWNH